MKNLIAALAASLMAITAAGNPPYPNPWQCYDFGDAAGATTIMETAQMEDPVKFCDPPELERYSNRRGAEDVKLAVLGGRSTDDVEGAKVVRGDIHADCKWTILVPVHYRYTRTAAPADNDYAWVNEDTGAQYRSGDDGWRFVGPARVPAGAGAVDAERCNSVAPMTGDDEDVGPGAWGVRHW